MTGLLDTVRALKRPERTVTLCLRGDLVAEYEDLERALRDAFSSDGDTAPLVARMDELQAEMHAAEVTFRFRAIGLLPTLEMTTAHPARPDVARDKELGFNPTTFYAAVVRACCYALTRGDETVAAGELTDEDWSTMFDTLSNDQFDKLFGAAWLCDHSEVEVPTSPLASLISQRAGESSTRRGAGERVSSGSQAGSRRKSQRTSTTKKAASSEA